MVVIEEVKKKKRQNFSNINRVWQISKEKKS